MVQMWFLLVLILSGISMTYAQISKIVSYEKITISTVGGQTEFGACELMEDAGKPVLPVEYLTFILPGNTDINKITVSIKNATIQPIAGTYIIRPGSPPVSTEGKIRLPEASHIVEGKDINIYENNAFYPENFCQLVSTSSLRGFKLATVKITPFRYNPVNGQLHKLSGCKLILNYETNNQPALSWSDYSKSEVVIRQLKSIACNFDDFDKHYGLQRSASENRQKPKYVIITTSAIVNGVSALSGFISSKQARGFDVQVIDEKTWGGGASAKLRDWLIANYQTLKIEYALLIGNPHPTNGDVPMLGSAFGSKNPTDFCYAELTGTWGSSTSGLDNMAEIAIGRISCYGSQDYTNVNNILGKIIAYENEPRQTSESWRNSMLMSVKLIASQCPGWAPCEAIKTDFLTPMQWKSYRIYDQDYGKKPDKIGTTVSSVVSEWTSKPYGLSFWFTHGSETLAQDIMDISNAAKLSSAKPTMVFQGSCLTGYPENSGNLGYTMLKNGAISTLASSRVSYELTDPKSKTYINAAISYRYAEALLKDSLPCGDAVNYIRSYLGKPSGGTWAYEQFLNWNLLGDPSVGIYTCKSGNTSVNDKKSTPQAFLPGIRINGAHIIYQVLHTGGSSPSSVTITLHDFKGRLLQTLIDHTHPADGIHSVYLKAPVSAGYYLCRLGYNGNVQTERVIVKN